ncbi:MAG TPA: hypothetical protein VJ836_00640 [Candidatus Saccharimonadales bacterium]|nr:hypothetical protein [Candidatus Saccharimonadales bacterium]
MYKITIVKEEIITEVEKSYEKTSDTGNKRDNGAVYEYISHPVTKTVEKQVLQQRVDDLDMAHVIKAINGLE